MPSKQLLATIKDRCRELGLSEGEFSQAVAGHKTVLTDIRRGRSPSAERLKKISEVLDLEFYIGPRRDVLANDALATMPRAVWEGDWSDREIAAIAKAMEMADAADGSNDFLIGALKAGLLAGASSRDVPDDHALSDMAQAMREAGWSDREIAAVAKAMEMADASKGSHGFLVQAFKLGLVQTFKQGRLAKPSPRPLLHAAENSAQTLNRAIIDAGGDPIPDDLWPVLASRRGSGVPMPTNENLPQGAEPVEIDELAATAGGGAGVSNEKVVDRLWFRRDWLAERGLDSSQCTVIRVNGESMEPLLYEGASILVDRKRRRRIKNRIFAVRTDDGLIVKRAGRDGVGKWQLLSEHPSWSPAPWPADAETIGQAIWTARSLI